MHKECFPPKGWSVLDAIKSTMAKHRAVLAGGTALALHVGHRESVDLDFFTAKAFRPESILAAIGKAGLSFQVLDEGDEHVVVLIDGVKFSLFRYEYAFLDRTIEHDGVSIAGVLDIAAMKIIAISQRGAKRDFADMYFILQQVPFHKIASHMVARFGRDRINPVLIGKGMVYFKDADSHPEPIYRGNAVRWETVKVFFRNHARQFVLDLDAAVRGR